MHNGATLTSACVLIRFCRSKLTYYFSLAFENIVTYLQQICVLFTFCFAPNVMDKSCNKYRR